MNINGNQVRICFIAPTGFGKTTAANIIAELDRRAINIKIAQPLYDLQHQFYQRLGIDIQGKQDGEFLQFIGHKVQREAPEFLADEFEKRLNRTTTLLVTNDDCRSHNASRLRTLGFIFVKINGFCRIRDDHRRLDPNHPVESGIEDIACDYELSNFMTMDVYRKDVQALLRKIRRNAADEEEPS